MRDTDWRPSPCPKCGNLRPASEHPVCNNPDCVEAMSDNLPRWHVSIIYQGETGPVVVDHDVEEVADVHDIVERGPNWNAILDISIQLNRRDESVYLQSPIQRGRSQ